MELHVRVVSARNLIDKQTFGRQDPYCKVSVGNKKFKTRVHDNGDRTPVWNEKFVFEVYDPQLAQLHIQIKDKNFTASVLIGEVRLPVNMFQHGAVTDQWYTVNNGSKRAGEINLRVQLLGGRNGGGMATKPAKMAQGYATAVAPAAAYNYASAPPGYPPYQQQPPPQAYLAPPQYAQPPPPQYAQPPPPQYAQPPPPQYAQPPPPQYAQPPPPQYAPPPPVYQMGPPPPPPMVIAAPPPVLMAPPPPVVYTPAVAYGAPGYYPSHHHHHDGDGGYYRGGGVSGGQVALGVGAGVVGGLLLGEVLDDIF